MNHSPAFWAVVADVLPDHVQRRQALRRVRLQAG
jgi:predicted metal-dependent hydrolase